MKKALALCLAFLLLTAACTGPERGPDLPGEGEYILYFAMTAGEENSPRDGAVLGREYRTLPEGREEVEGLVDLLLAGPTVTGLVSPFPAGLGLRSWTLDEGVLTLDLSEVYGGLTGMDLTLADGCLVITLCQLPQVEAVYLTVEGRARPFRDQIMTASDFLLDNTLKGIAPPDEEGGGESAPEERATESGEPVESLLSEG